jgi:hypothetical protein
MMNVIERIKWLWKLVNLGDKYYMADANGVPKASDELFIFIRRTDFPRLRRDYQKVYEHAYKKHLIETYETEVKRNPTNQELKRFLGFLKRDMSEDTNS